ncbi:MAG TPA: hypothetical protein VNT81_00265 [Vicinamibacterales bacterium]|nr:hypothetical protein [Vicinamibacterales bacterium]
MKQFSSFAAAAAVALALGTSAAGQATVAVPAAGNDKEITITGCVVKGDGGYILTNVAQLPAQRTGTEPGAPPVAMATTAMAPNTLFWLDDDEDLEDHAGQHVEVRGEIERDIDRGEIEIEREGGMIEIEIKAKGEKVTVKLPDSHAAQQAVGTTGVVTDKPRELEFVVRKFDVKSVKTLSHTCPR